MAAPDFLVHDKVDSVGVVVVENAEAGKELTGIIMETAETVSVKSLDDIPLGHKIAMSDIKNGDTILKYGQDIGKAVADIARGGHAHTQNVKTKRW